MLKIISGGQTGVDRAALDAALKTDTPCGGWCPDARKAEDGVIPDFYPVLELEGGGYRQRTKKNVQDSDGTVIIFFEELSGGTQLTQRFCENEGKPYLLVDGDEVPVELAAEKIKTFSFGISGDVINFAGPRASNVAHAYDYTLDAVTRFITLYKIK